MDKKKIIILLVLILAIAGFFRLWQLNSIPPGVYPDEAINGNEAIKAVETGQYKLFYPENNGREGLLINLIAFSFNIFGVHIWSLKLVSALIGILTVLGLYFLTKELFKSPGIALLSAFFLAISFWHINFSRIAFRGILVPFCLVWSFYFLYKAINKYNIWHLLLSGFFFALGFYTYIAFRVAVIILIVPIIQIIRKKSWHYAFWILMIIIVALPIGLYFLQNPQDFIGRAGGVSIFTQENPLKAIVISTIKTLGMFNVRGDWNWRHNFAGSPQLLWPIGLFFLIGLILSIKKLWVSDSHRYWLILIWFGVMLLPPILTYEGLPHALRSIGVIPVCYIFAALGLVWFAGLLKKHLKNSFLFFCFFAVLLLGLGYAQYDKYFIDWARQPDVEGAFAKNYLEIGEYLNTLPPATAGYVIVNQPGVLVKEIPMPAQTVMFIEKTINNKQLTINNKQATIYLLPEEIDKIEATNNFIVIPLQYDRQIFKTLKKTFPKGKVEFHKSFWLFKI